MTSTTAFGNIVTTLSADRRDMKLAAVTSALSSVCSQANGGSEPTPAQLFAALLTSLTKGQHRLELLKLMNAMISYAPSLLVKSNVATLVKLTPGGEDKAVLRQVITLYGHLVTSGGDGYETCLSSILAHLTSSTPKTRKHSAGTLKFILENPTTPAPVHHAIDDFVLEILSDVKASNSILTLLRPVASLLSDRVALALVKIIDQPATLPFLVDVAQNSESRQQMSEDVKGQLIAGLLKKYSEIPKVSIEEYALAITSFSVSNPSVSSAVVWMLITMMSSTPNITPTFKRYVRNIDGLDEVKVGEALGKRVALSGNGEGVEVLGWWGEVRENGLRSAVAHLVSAHASTTNNKAKRSIVSALSSIVSARGHGAVINLKIYDDVVLQALKVDSDVACDLELYKTVMLPLARQADVKSRSNTLTAAEQQTMKAKVSTIWEIAIPFCNNSTNSQNLETFIPTIVKVMSDVKYDLTSVGTKCLTGMVTCYPALATSIGGKVVTSLFNVADKSDKDSVKLSIVCSCIQSWVAGGAPVGGIFKKLLQRMLTNVQPPYDAEKVEKVNHLLTLLLSILGGVEGDNIKLVFRTVKTIIRTGKCGKKSFRVLAQLLETQGEVLTNEGPAEIIEIITDSLLTCDVGSRLERLKSLKFVIENLDNSTHPNVVPETVGEVLLCLKDSNMKVREAGYENLLLLCERRGDVKDFFQIVVGAIAAKTPHMRSAAVMGLSRLVFERRECEITRSLVGDLLSVVCILFKEKAREVIKSAVGFVRVAVASMTKEDLEHRLEEVVNGLMLWNSGKDRFRAKIKIILKKLIRTYGHELIKELVPKDDERLITHIRKVAEREKRKRANGGGEGIEDDFEGMMDDDERDSDGGKTFMSGMTGATGLTALSRMTGKTGKTVDTKMTGKTGKTAKSNITADGKLTGGVQVKGGLVDMLDTGSNLKWVGDGNEQDEFEDGSDDEVMEFDDMGRLVVDDFDGVDGGEGGDDIMEVAGDLIDAAKSAREMSKNNAGEGGSRQMKYEIAQEKAEKHRQKRQRQDASNAPGAQFKSKKAGGDVKKKGAKFEPYAYIPLDGKGYTKKHRGKTVEMMGSIVRTKGQKKAQGGGERAGGRGKRKRS
ncbi:hypothetical protein TL16_g05432, partial [Triparma laevis f. inornata]